MFLLFRNIKFGNRDIYIRLYKSYILPLLEYAVQVWSPSLKRDIAVLERVQKTFTRILYYKVFPNKNYPHALPGYEIRLQCFDLHTLYYRRIFADLVLAFRILRLETRLRPSAFWVWKPCYGRVGAFNFHYHSCNRCRCKKSLFDTSFFVRSAKLLQMLPPKLTAASDGECFKRRLKSCNILMLLNLDDLGLRVQ
ncbi:hypothetical protein Y032_0304g1918 [Ancylostoma ceylanicum]|uniref:Uncharacterized protein n=1 Tax=Ancylostoma ceylanicum TaxID=53326 RepID=A0A016S4G2_9BILA|nr:hypothetical protein Y032_0304g1918 [Ancylostoma ceylanicum]